MGDKQQQSPQQPWVKSKTKEERSFTDIMSYWNTKDVKKGPSNNTDTINTSNTSNVVNTKVVQQPPQSPQVNNSNEDLNNSNNNNSISNSGSSVPVVEENLDDSLHFKVSLEKIPDLTNHPIVSLIKQSEPVKVTSTTENSEQPTSASSSPITTRNLSPLSSTPKQQKEDLVQNWANISRQSTNSYTVGISSGGEDNGNNNKVDAYGNATDQTNNSYVVGNTDLDLNDTSDKLVSSPFKPTDLSIYSVNNTYSTSYSSNSESGVVGNTDSSAYSTYSQSGSSSYAAYAASISSYDNSSGDDKDIRNICKTNVHNTPQVSLLEDEGDSICTMQEKRDLGQNWNTKFQDIVDKPESEEKYKQLTSIANEFVYCANTFGKIIISEKNLPDDSKTILPLGLGGIAGGSKYKLHDIIFKFVADTEIAEDIWMYGESSRSDEKAQKSAGHELKGLNYYMEYAMSKGIIRFPLMAIIDYRGYRLLAISSLPIGKNTIVYGSNDAGKSVHNSDPIIDAEMRRIGEILHLKGHLVGLTPNAPVLLHAPGDIEVHKGYDGRYYMIDFARTFPPEYPALLRQRVGREIFYNLLRPELIQSTDNSYSSDAFSGWQSGKDEEENNREVVDITSKLHNEIIPEVVSFLQATLEGNDVTSKYYDGSLAEYLKSSFLSNSKKKIENDLEKKSEDIRKIINYTHSKGINTRYLGIVCQTIVHRVLRQLFMSEIAARVWKRLIRAKLRQMMERVKRPSDEPKKVIAFVFELLLKQDVDDKYKEFWMTTKPGGFKYSTLHAFPLSLSNAEMSDRMDLRLSLDRKFVVWRLIQIMNIRINKESFDLFMSDPKYVFGVRDIEEVESTVKYPTIIDYANGCSMLLEASHIDHHNNYKDCVRLIEKSQYKLNQALSSMPLSHRILIKLSNTYLQKAKITGNPDELERYLLDVCNVLSSPAALLPIGEIYAIWGVAHLKLSAYYLYYKADYVAFRKHLEIANEKLERALEMDQDSVELYISQVLPVKKDMKLKELNGWGIENDIETQRIQRRRVFEIIATVYLLSISSHNGRLRTFLPLALGDVTELSPLELSRTHQKILDQDGILNEVFLSVPNLLKLVIKQVQLSIHMIQGVTSMRFLNTLELSFNYVSIVDEAKYQEAVKEGLASPDDLPVKNANDLMKKILESTPLLVNLKITGTNFADEELSGLGPQLTNLKSLALCQLNITDKVVIEYAPYLTQLESLEISYLRSVSAQGLKTLLEQTTNLKCLMIPGMMSSANDDCAPAITQIAPHLTKLYLSRSRMSAENITEIIKNTTLNLQVLDLSGCATNSLTYEALQLQNNLTGIYLDSSTTDNWDSFISSLTMMDCNNLKTLQFPNICRDFKNWGSIWNVFRRFSNLEKIKFPSSFSMCDLMSTYNQMDCNEELLEIPLKKVKNVNMFNSTTDIPTLIKFCELVPLLETLSLSAVQFTYPGTRRVAALNETMLLEMGPILQYIQHLDLSNQPIDRRHIDCLLSRCGNMKSLTMLNCKGITSQDIFDLTLVYPRVYFQNF